MPDKSYDYNFKLKQSGTFWMHSHYGYQEQTYVEAPLIIYPKGYNPKNDVVIMFQDFSFKKPETIMKELTSETGSSHGSMNMSDSTKSDEMDMSKHDNMDMGAPKSEGNHKPNTMKMNVPMDHTGDMGSHADLNDVNYDAFLNKLQYSRPSSNKSCCCRSNI